MSLNDKVILVTGGTGSFGRKFAETRAERYKPTQADCLQPRRAEAVGDAARVRERRTSATSSATCATATGFTARCAASTSSSTPPR